MQLLLRSRFQNMESKQTPRKIDGGTPHLTIMVQSKDIVTRPECLHNALAFVIVIAQCFGIMPVQGVTHSDYRKIKFEWKSLKFVYTVFNVLCSSICAALCFMQLTIIGLMLDKTAALSFYICNFLAALYFVRIAQNWNYFIQEWSKVELSMKRYGVFCFKKRFRIMTATVLLLALAEHLLFVLNALNFMWRCGYTQQNAEVYFSFAFPHVFTVTPYTHWKAALAEIANILSTFCWNFLDLFIMLLSSALALMFKQVGRRIKRTNVMYESVWRRIREDYNKLTHLCAILEKNIAPLVVLSFASNIYFICIQLYNSLKPRYGIIPTVYFFFSFGFLLGRTLAVSLYAAWINDASKKPLGVLHAIPSESYSLEIERLIQQIHRNPTGISGCRFFFITRSFILRIAGTIITFELMLLQFGPLLSENSQFTIEDRYKECEAKH